MSNEDRYYSDADPEHGVTHEELANLPEEEQREYVTNWFFRNFEDPAQETPYQSSEGGYIYIWGGPYDAREEIEGQFHDILSEALIEEIVGEVEADGTTDWAPGREHPDHIQAAKDFDESWTDPEPDFDRVLVALSAGIRPELGSHVEIELRSKLAETSGELLGTLNSLKGARGGIGHNGPPTDDEGNPIPPEFEEGVREAAEIILKEASSDDPSVLEIAKASKRLQQFKEWLKPKADVAADEFAKAFGKTLGVGAAGVISAALAMAITSVLGVSWDWLSSLLPNF